LTFALIEKLEAIDFSNFNFNNTYTDAKDALIRFIKLDNDDGLDLTATEFLNRFNQHMNVHDKFRHTELKEYIPDLWNLLNGN